MFYIAVDYEPDVSNEHAIYHGELSEIVRKALEDKGQEIKTLRVIYLNNECTPSITLNNLSFLVGGHNG